MVIFFPGVPLRIPRNGVVSVRFRATFKFVGCIGHFLTAVTVSSYELLSIWLKAAPWRPKWVSIRNEKTLKILYCFRDVFCFRSFA